MIALSKTATVAATVATAAILAGSGYAAARANQIRLQNQVILAETAPSQKGSFTDEDIAQAQKAPMTMALMFFKLLSVGDVNRAYKSFILGPNAQTISKDEEESDITGLQSLAGLKIVGIGAAEKADFPWRMKVPYNVEIKSETFQTMNGPVSLKRVIVKDSLWVRNDNSLHLWTVDGGMPATPGSAPESSAQQKHETAYANSAKKIAFPPTSPLETTQTFLSFLSIGDVDKAYSMTQGVGYLQIPKESEDNLKTDFKSNVGIMILSIGNPVKCGEMWRVSYRIAAKSESVSTASGPKTLKGVISDGILGIENNNPLKRWEVCAGMP